MAIIDKKVDLMHRHHPFISIIIPAYNAATYLPKLLDSIIKQNYDSWEAIVIDDGSHDNTAEIVEEYSEKDHRIKLIRQNNTGVSGARNTGINASVGEWIWFVDSDDEILPDAMQCMANAVAEKPSDILYADYETHPHKDYRPDISLPITIDREAAATLLFGSDFERFWGYVWCKLFRREVIKKNEVYFRDGLYFNEDSLFIFEFLSVINRPCFILKCQVYRYYIRQISTMGQIESPAYWKYESDLDACLIMTTIAKAFSVDIQNMVLNRTYRSYKRNKKLIYRYGSDDRIAIRRISNKIKCVLSHKQMIAFEIRSISRVWRNRFRRYIGRITK